MLVVKTYLAPVPGKGLGLFAAEPIPAGAVWWKDDRAFNRVISQAELEALPAMAREFVYAYSFVTAEGDYYLCTDDGRFTNHSDDPNTCPSGSDWIAARDIAAGEELTCDYRVLCLGCRDGLPFVNVESRPAEGACQLQPQ